MEEFPKLGMTHEQARKRLLRYDKNKTVQLKESMVNQVRLCEGDKSATEVSKEIDSKLTPSRGGCHTNFTLRPTMTVSGVGEGNKLKICKLCGHRPAKSERVDGNWVCSIHKSEVIG